MNGRSALRTGHPRKLVRRDDVHMVVVPGIEGEFGVMAGHAPFMTTLKDGEIEVYSTAGAEPEKIAVTGGFAEVGENGPDRPRRERAARSVRLGPNSTALH